MLDRIVRGYDILRQTGASVSMLLVLSSFTQAELLQIIWPPPKSSGYALLGAVMDDGGTGVIPGARITVRDESSGQTHLALSNLKGEYRIASLASGSYRIRIESRGFATVEGSLHIGLTRDTIFIPMMSVTPMYERAALFQPAKNF